MAVGLAACGASPDAALHGPDPLHAHALRLPPRDAGLPPPAIPDEPVHYPVPPPPLSEGIFPCSRCHLGGTAEPDRRPAMPHRKHLNRDLVCADCHSPGDGKADPTIPPASLCFDCHESDLAKEPEGVRAYFASVRQPDGSYAFPARWKTRDAKSNHGGHAAAGIDCATCHGEATDGPYLKPKPLVLMQGCSECHAKRGVADACATCHRETTEPRHGNIVLRHGGEHRACLDCHHPDDRDLLRLAHGTTVPFEESYRLCGQCHGPQLREWKEGIHGKRTGMWDGEKQYLLCVHCHSNPHAPAIPPMRPLPPPARPEEIR